MQNFLEKNYKLIITAILLFMLITSVLNAYWDTAIFDETAHIPAGYTYLRYGDMRLNPEHPPLLKDLSAIPLLFMNLNFDTTEKFWATDVNGQWDAGRHLLWQAGNDGHQIVFWSRIPFVLLSLILGIFIFRWTKELAGLSAGLFALTLYAFDPNILGHNHFVTTDLGIAAFATFSFYYFLRFLKDPSWKNVFWGGMFLGLLQLVKFSSVTLFPIMGLALFIYSIAKRPRDLEKNNFSFKLKTFGEYLTKGIVAFLVSILLVWGVYAINTYNMPKEKLTETIEFYFPANDNSSKIRLTNKFLIPLANNSVTKPLSEYILGIAMVFKRVEGGNGAYFLGQVSGKAFPAYFPTVFLLKEPLPNLYFMIIALIFTVILFFQKISWSIRETWKEKISFIASYLRTNITSLTLFSFILLYSYISITGNLNIGFRHLFPILPFIYILTAKTIFEFVRRYEYRTQYLWFSVILFFTALLISETSASYPYYMSYFNQIANGPKNGYHYATDSNADWGQDLKRLAKWIEDYNTCTQVDTPLNRSGYCDKIVWKDNYNWPEEAAIEKIRVDYFGGADIKTYIGDKYQIWWDSKRPLEPGWYAISTNFSQGSIYDQTKKDNESYRWLKGIKPIYQVGTSIFIYNLTEKELETINKEK